MSELLGLLSHFTHTQVVLVAQSYGGLVATAAATRVCAQIAALVYIDAILPEHGKSMLATVPVAFADAYRARQSIEGGMSVILPERGHMQELRSVEDCSFIAGNISAQPFASFDEPVDLGGRYNVLAGIPLHYLHCSAHSIDPSASLYTKFAQRAAMGREWSYRNIPLGFYCVLSAPGSVAEAIIEAVHGASGGLSSNCLKRVLSAVDDADGSPISLAELACIAGLSTWHFARCFKQSMGIPPHTYLVTRQLEKAARLLKQSDLMVHDVAQLSGFSSPSRFAIAFRQAIGMTPHAFRNLRTP